MKEREFREALVEELRKALGEEFEVESQDCSRINHVDELAIAIKKEGTTVTPIIPTGKFFKEYQGEKTIEDIVRDILHMLQNDLNDTTKLQRVFDIEDWESSKNRIRLRLINTERNKELLENVPHVNFLNLSIVCFIRAIETEDSVTTIIVDKKLQDKYGVSTEELFKYGLDNVEKEAVIGDIDAAFGGLIAGERSEDSFTTEDVRNSNTGLFVLSNKSRMNGCAGIVSEKIRKNLIEAFEGLDLIIFPSSIHELIMIVDDGRRDAEALLEIVKSANRKVVKERDFLADAVYKLNGTTGEVELLIEEK